MTERSGIYTIADAQRARYAVEAQTEIERLRAQRDALLSALDDLINDCINFDNGCLTTVILKKACAVRDSVKERRQ